MSFGKTSILLVLCSVAIGYQLLTQPHRSELFSVIPHDTLELGATHWLSQKIYLVPEVDEIALLFPPAMIGRSVHVRIHQDTAGAPGEIQWQNTVAIAAHPAGAALHVSYPSATSTWVWVSIQSSDGRPVSFLHEIDGFAYEQGSLLLDDTRRRPGVLGFALYHTSHFPLQPFTTAASFAGLLIAWIVIAHNTKSRLG